MKKKFRNSEAAKASRQLSADWVLLQQKYAPKIPIKLAKGKLETPKENLRETDNSKIKSLGSWVTGTVSSKPSNVYTGECLKGIGTMHKSNAIPVFDSELAVDLANMRR